MCNCSRVSRRWRCGGPARPQTGWRDGARDRAGRVTTATRRGVRVGEDHLDHVVGEVRVTQLSAAEECTQCRCLGPVRRMRIRIRRWRNVGAVRGLRHGVSVSKQPPGVEIRDTGSRNFFRPRRTGRWSRDPRCWSSRGVPKSEDVAVEEGDPADPLGALPRVALGMMTRAGPPCSAGSGAPFHVWAIRTSLIEADLSGLVEYRRSLEEDMGGGVWVGRGPQGLDGTKRLKGHVQLAPGGDAMEVTGISDLGQGLKGVPVEGDGALDPSTDLEAPLGGGNLGFDAEVEDRGKLVTTFVRAAPVRRTFRLACGATGFSGSSVPWRRHTLHSRGGVRLHR